MKKQIFVEYDDKNYTLEYNRSSVEKLERQGFTINLVDEKPMTMLPMLFSGAFLANHSNIKRTVVDAIFNSMNNKTELYGALGEMYGDTLNSLFEETEGGEKNVTWEKSF